MSDRKCCRGTLNLAVLDYISRTANASWLHVIGHTRRASLVNCGLAETSPGIPLEISAEQTKSILAAGLPLLLIDVREPAEHVLAAISGAELIPMQTVPQRITYFEDREEPVICFCHHGVRSLHVAAWLRERGVDNAQSMTGGIDAWSRRIDPGVPRY